jgi:ATP-dependent Lon protease
VRELERKLTSAYRNIALKEVTRSKHRVYKLDEKNIEQFIGVPEYQYNEIPDVAEYGYAIGLAWTETGGEILPIEVSLVPGQHKLTLTGKIGEVMEESATAGLTYIRSHADRFGIDRKTIANTEIHIHVPEAAIPKEGPSAGITMVAAMLSALTQRRISTKIAMTGEISLTGDIFPVGGLNEKLLAAKRVGITDVIMPAKNSRDITELPKALLKGLRLRQVRKLDEALKIIFGPELFQSPRKAKKKGSTGKKSGSKAGAV